MSNLETKLDELLAPALGVTPDEVTAAVERWHDEHPFPIERYETASIYGGYITHRTHLPTEQELREMRERSDAFLDQYSDVAGASLLA